jgi:hypothetical protein
VVEDQVVQHRAILRIHRIVRRGGRQPQAINEYEYDLHPALILAGQLSGASGKSARKRQKTQKKDQSEKKEPPVK